MFNVLAAPSEVFNEIKSSTVFRTSSWLAPTIIWAVVGAVGVWLMFSQDTVKQQLSDMQDKAIQKQVESGKLTKEQADQALQATERIGDLPKKILGVVSVAATAFGSAFWWGLVIWGLGTLVFKSNLGYMAAVEVAGLSNMVRVLESVLKSLLIVILGSMFAAPNLGFALYRGEFDAGNLLHTALAQVDLFSLWVYGVRAAGLAALCRISFGKAALWMYGIYLVLSGLAIAVAALSKSVFSL
jgi:hypothetical protein